MSAPAFDARIRLNLIAERDEVQRYYDLIDREEIVIYGGLRPAPLPFTITIQCSKSSIDRVRKTYPWMHVNEAGRLR